MGSRFKLDRSGMKTAGDIMTSPAISCTVDAFFEEIADLLADHDIAGVPVVDRIGRVVGVVSERDLAHAWGGPMVRLSLRRPNHLWSETAAGALPRWERRATEVMTSPAITVETTTAIEEVAALMRDHQINRLPVADSGLLVGVVTRGDVLGVIAEYLLDENVS
jgi:acetoin utilization protein AcuB